MHAATSEPTILSMISFASLAYLVIFGIAAFSIYAVAVLLGTEFEEKKVTTVVARTVLSRRGLRGAKRLLASASPTQSMPRKIRALVRAASSTVILPLMVTLVFWVLWEFFFGLVFQGSIPDWASTVISCAAAVLCAVVVIDYVAGGGRTKYRYFTVITSGISMTSRESRSAIAARMFAINAVELAAALYASASFFATLYRANSLMNAVPAVPVGWWYLVGIVPLLLFTRIVLWVIPRSFPTDAAHRLLLQVVATRAEGQRGIQAVRPMLVKLPSLLERCAMAHGRSELAAGIQSPQAVILRSAAARLRQFLSTRESMTMPMSTVQNDLMLIGAVLTPHPASEALADLGVRMHAFMPDGQPCAEFHAAYHNRLSLSE
jgi:hypothetical protein